MQFKSFLYYALLAIILFFVKNYLNYKYEKNNSTIITLIYIVFASALASSLNINYINNNIFLIVLIETIIRVFYNYIVLDNSQLIDNSEYFNEFIFTFICSIILNIIFINRVDTVIPTGESLKNVIWLFIILYIFYGFKSNKIPKKKKTSRLNNYKYNKYIITNYAKFKSEYHTYIKMNNNNLKTLLYAIMIYENKKKGHFLRKIDNLFFGHLTRINRLGIMQIETKTFINDYESVIAASKILSKIEKNLNQNNRLIEVKEILSQYYKEDTFNNEILYIYNIINEFNQIK